MSAKVEAPRWKLEVLGGARLSGPAGAPRLERKTAAVLAYLALEGSTAKYQLAGLLWPDSPETTARNNMRQLLRRLRVATGAELVAGEVHISLSEAVSTDAAGLRAHALAGRHAQVLELQGELLAGLDFDDCPEFDAWLQRTREQLLASRLHAANTEADRLEQRGELARAMELATRSLALEPCSEEAYRRLMRLHYLAGDRAAALGAFEQCRLMLQRELDTVPMPETSELARRIERGAPPSRPVARARPPLPLSVLRPPTLVGREKEWMQLEAAWEAGQFIVIMGEPGVGKSRLARDFAASKGAFVVHEARPGDLRVAYSSATRALRSTLAQRPGVSLAPWILREMARLMPEFGEPPPPMRDETDKLRMFEAHAEAIHHSSTGLSAIVVDDVQYIDPASLELSEYLFARHYPLRSTGMPPLIDCCRRDELPAGTLEAFQRLMAAGQMVLIELEPLPPGSVDELLRSLELPGTERLASDLTRFTGGNPLFIVETLKYLLETGGLERGWPDRLPPSGKVRALIQQRLARLSPQALQVARVAALAHDAFRVELAGEVLQVPPLSLEAALVELESALVLKGEHFVHDLVFEAVREGIPSSLEALLHRRLAECLEKRRVSPSSVANHWLEGGEPQKAVPFLLAAAEADEAALRHLEASARYTQAGALLEVAGQGTEASRIRARAEHTARAVRPSRQ